MSNTIKVLPILSANDLSTVYHSGSQFEARLVNSHGNAFKDQSITFNINRVFQ